MIWIYFTLKFCLFPLLKNSCTVIKILYSRTCICGPVYSGHSVYYGHRTTSLNFQLPYIFCKVDLFIGVTLYITVTLPFPLLKNSCTVIKILYSRTCICGPVYSGHSVYYGHRTTSLNFQLPYIFCKVDLFIGVTLYITVTLPFPKGDCCTHVWLYIIEYKI